MTEDYISFETAKLLKEKGFKNSNDMLLGKSGRHYNKYETFPSKDMAIEASIDCEDKCPLVTLQMAMKWLREVHNINLNIDWNPSFKDYFVEIFKPTLLYSTTTYQNYEQASKAAIRYCLENLI